MTHGKGNVVPASGSFNSSFYSYGGNPNGNVTAANKGDFCIDTSTPAIWQATAMGNTSWITANAGGSVQLLSFPFAFDTPNLTAGAILYTPNTGDILYNAWIEVTTPWNGDTPQADIGLWNTLPDTPSGFVNGLISSSESQSLIDMTHGDGDPASNGMLMNFGQWGSLDANVASAHLRSLPAKFLTDTPVSVVVSQSGTSGGLDVGASQGAAILHLIVGNTTSVAGGSAPGYQQVTFSYNGNGPFVADCMVGEGWDPTAGGFITGQFPIEAYFGPQSPGSPLTFGGTAYIDSTGIVQTFMLIQAGMGGAIITFDNAGAQVQTYLDTPYLGSNAGINIVDHSASGINITENGVGGITMTGGDSVVSMLSGQNGTTPTEIVMNGANGIVYFSGQTLELQLPNQGVYFYTANTPDDLTTANQSGSFGFTSQPHYYGGSTFNKGHIYSWDATYDQWAPITQNIGYLEVRADYNGTATFNGDTPVTNVSPYWSDQPVSLVSNASPTGYAMSPLATLSPGTSIQVYLSPHFTLLATGNAATPNWNYVDANGTLVIWDATGTNLLSAYWYFNAIQSDTANFTVDLTQQNLIGTDLSLVSNNQIMTTAGGIYNISIQANCSWD